MRAIDEIERLKQKVADGSMSPNEPLFVLRAQDCIAADLVYAWATKARNLGSPPEKCDEAISLADAMSAWPVRKVPGVMKPSKVYEILIAECGAANSQSAVLDFCREFSLPIPPSEWRFQGNLGFGGKLYFERGKFRVGCYPEDRTPERIAMIDRANTRLAKGK